MADKKKTVAIIGGGPSGLTTAKSMLTAGLLPTVFEARQNPGGLWAPREAGLEGTQLNPEMRTNASLACNMFSDWFPYGEEKVLGHSEAGLVAEYLNSYAQRFLGGGQLRLGCEVVEVVPVGPREECEWRVVFRDAEGGEEEETFDFLVVASGAQSQLYIPHLEDLANFPGKAIHSYNYVAEEMFPANDGDRTRRILVVGGLLSGAEIPAELALRVSSLPEERRDKVEILHLFSQPFWILPRLLPFTNEKDPQAPRVLPLDQVFFTADAVMGASPSESPEEKNTRLNGLLKALMGSDQGDIGPEYQIDDHWSTKTPGIGMSESYHRFVKSGAIKPIVGRYEGITDTGAVRVSPVPNSTHSTDRTLEGIDTIIFATGYTPWPALRKFFAPEMLQKMGVSPETVNPHANLLFSRMHKQVMHPELGRTIGFVGLQMRPYWGLSEIQGRWLANMFSGKLDWPTDEEIADYRKGVDHLVSIGKLNDALLLNSQGGYLEVIGDISRILGIDPFTPAASVTYTPKSFMPAYYPPFGTAETNDDATKAIRSLSLGVVNNSFSPAFVSKVVFAELQGKWKLTRNLASKLPGYPEGEFVGLAEFHPRIRSFTAFHTGEGQWTAGPAKASYLSLGRDVPEYLYSEEGDLTTKSGLVFHGKRKYIYHYDDAAGAITAWFVKLDGSSVDNFFHHLDFTKTPEKLGSPGVEGDGGWKAAGEHLCSKDWYWPAYRFVFRGARLERFWIRYKVLGPSKDYISEAMYVRA